MDNPNFTPENLAWAAGLFDGEGCSTLAGRRYKGEPSPWVQPRLSIAQCDPEVLEKFQSIFGVGTISKPYRHPSRPNARRTYNLAIAGHPRFQYVIAAMWKYLGSVKREQARCVLDGWRKAHEELHFKTRLAQKGIRHLKELRARGLNRPQIAKITGMNKDLVYFYLNKRRAEPRISRPALAFDTPYFNSL